MIDTNLEIYSARLTFKRNSKSVNVDLRYNRLGEIKKREVPIPEDIDLYELSWIKYRKKIISIYHRKLHNNELTYMDSKHTIAPTSLGQRLEKLVSDVYYFHAGQQLKDKTSNS